MIQSLQNTVVQNGVGLGAVIAVVVSWQRNRSILWAIFHGICSWFYVIYFALTEEKKERSAGGDRSGILVVFVVLVIVASIAFVLIAQSFKR